MLQAPIGAISGAGRGAKERPFHCTGSCGIRSLPSAGCFISARKDRVTYCSDSSSSAGEKIGPNGTPWTAPPSGSRRASCRRTTA